RCPVAGCGWVATAAAAVRRPGLADADRGRADARRAPHLAAAAAPAVALPLNQSRRRPRRPRAARQSGSLGVRAGSRSDAGPRGVARALWAAGAWARSDAALRCAGAGSAARRVRVSAALVPAVAPEPRRPARQRLALAPRPGRAQPPVSTPAR